VFFLKADLNHSPLLHRIFKSNGQRGKLQQDKSNMPKTSTRLSVQLSQNVIIFAAFLLSLTHPMRIIIGFSILKEETC